MNNRDVLVELLNLLISGWVKKLEECKSEHERLELKILIGKSTKFLNDEFNEQEGDNK